MCLNGSRLQKSGTWKVWITHDPTRVRVSRVCKIPPYIDYKLDFGNQNTVMKSKVLLIEDAWIRDRLTVIHDSLRQDCFVKEFFIRKITWLYTFLVHFAVVLAQSFVGNLRKTKLSFKIEV